MKIGILTLPLVNNYGGILQNYALQQIIKQLGCDPITFRSLNKHLRYSYWPLIVIKVLIAKLLNRPSSFPELPLTVRKRYKKQEQFIRTNIVTTHKKYIYLSNDIIQQYDLDAIVVGSDQVWRPMYNTRITDMFLGFCTKRNIRRIAYAASFGVDTWEFTNRQTEKCRKLIKQFDAVSVREASGITLCNQYLDYDATEVLDPTLLLPRDKYASICQDIPKNTTKHLIAYVLDMDESKRQIIESIASEKNLPVKYFSADKDSTLSVEEWISAFRDAALVVTDSFHGSVFSIIFNHDFYSIVNKGRGASRFYSLLSNFELTDRIITNADFNPTNSTKIDWDKVNDILERKKEESVEFLRKNLGTNKL